MEAILFIGIQATGKTSFYRERFFDTHLRLNMDSLKTRNREAVLLRACLDAKMKFVVDNTNPTREERSGYIQLARDAGFRIIGYAFRTTIEDALVRNAAREGVPFRMLLTVKLFPPIVYGSALFRLSTKFGRYEFLFPTRLDWRRFATNAVVPDRVAE